MSSIAKPPYRVFRRAKETGTVQNSEGFSQQSLTSQQPPTGTNNTKGRPCTSNPFREVTAISPEGHCAPHTPGGKRSDDGENSDSGDENGELLEARLIELQERLANLEQGHTVLEGRCTNALRSLQTQLSGAFNKLSGDISNLQSGLMGIATTGHQDRLATQESISSHHNRLQSLEHTRSRRRGREEITFLRSLLTDSLAKSMVRSCEGVHLPSLMAGTALGVVGGLSIGMTIISSKGG